MIYYEQENHESYDKLDFCLQSHEGDIIVTLLINQVPLYDCIIQKQAEFAHLTKASKNEFILESYNFEIYEQTEVNEETLFIHNFPLNLSPVDYKHPMIGMWFSVAYFSLVSIHADLEMFYLNNEKIPDDEFAEIYHNREKQLIICLCHTCGSVNCSNISMEIKQTEGKIEWFNFYSFSEYYHEKVAFSFKLNQYLEVLKRLKILNDNLKSYNDYCNFESERYNKNRQDFANDTDDY